MNIQEAQECLHNLGVPRESQSIEYDISSEWCGKHIRFSLSDSSGDWSLAEYGGERSTNFPSGDNTRMKRILLNDNDWCKDPDCSRANAWSLIKGDMNHSRNGIPDVLYIGRSGDSLPEIRTCYPRKSKKAGKFIRYATDDEIRRYVPK